MAIYTQTQLTSASNAAYVTNGANLITAAIVRGLNVDWISSSVLIPMTSSMTVLSSSYALTASYYDGSVVSASYSQTASSADNFVVRNNLTASNASFTGSVIISGSARGNVNALTVASNTASVDLTAGNFFTVTLDSSATTNFNVSNIRPGQTTNIVVTTGTNSTASFSSNVKQVSGSTYLPSSGSGKIDLLSMISVDSSNVYLVFSKNLI